MKKAKGLMQYYKLDEPSGFCTIPTLLREVPLVDPHFVISATTNSTSADCHAVTVTDME